VIGVRPVLTFAPLLLLALALGVDRLAGKLRPPNSEQADSEAPPGTGVASQG
jgi:hypothetical protein